jgi:hypothetical protein
MISERNLDILSSHWYLILASPLHNVQPEVTKDYLQDDFISVWRNLIPSAFDFRVAHKDTTLFQVFVEAIVELFRPLADG